MSDIDDNDDVPEIGSSDAPEITAGQGDESGVGAGQAIGMIATLLGRRRRKKNQKRNNFSTGRHSVGVGGMLFILGLFCGVPLAFFGFDTLVTHSAGFFGFLLGLLGTSLTLLILILIFRRAIWQSLYKRGEVEVEKMAAPLADIAKAATAQKLDDATDAARSFAEMVLARYAWLTTRRWIVGSITGLLAAIAALAGSTLLFQQNKLLAEQSVLIQGQTNRLDEQNYLLETQIALAEAERTALIGPEILNIAETIGAETAELREQLTGGEVYTLSDLSPGLRGRIVALTDLARPYRYLTFGEIDPRDQMAVLRKALKKRPGMLMDPTLFKDLEEETRKMKLIDHPLSPERGQILSILLGAGIRDTELLSFRGANFSFAELRMKTLGVTSYQHSVMSFADFSDMSLVEIKFGAAELYHTNFSNASINRCNFAGLAAKDIAYPFTAAPGLPFNNTRMTGANFKDAVINDSDFSNVFGLVLDFENAGLNGVNFTRSSLSGAIFKNSILRNVNFEGAALQSLDLQNAIVFEADFITRLGQQAAPNSFKQERWTLVKMATGETHKHPAFIELSNYVSMPELSKQAYRVIANPDFRDTPLSGVGR